MQLKSFILKDEAVVRLSIRKLCCETTFNWRVTKIFFYIDQNMVAIFQKLFVERILTFSWSVKWLEDMKRWTEKKCNKNLYQMTRGQIKHSFHSRNIGTPPDNLLVCSSLYIFVMYITSVVLYPMKVWANIYS